MKNYNRSSIKSFIFSTALLPSLLLPCLAQAAQYDLDVAHTDIGFTVRHLMVSNTRGVFKDFKGSLDFDPAKNTVKDVNVEVEVASIDTREPKRDTHLKTEEFFDAEKFPKMTFKLDSLTVVPKKAVKTKGTLTLRGVTKTVPLEITYQGQEKDPYGTMHSGFDITAQISRKEFGMIKGAPAVGDEVKITISGEAVPHVEKKM